MKMNEAVKKLVRSFGPGDDADPSPLVERILQVMPNKEVPDNVLRTVMAVGKALRAAGVK